MNREHLRDHINLILDQDKRAETFWKRSVPPLYNKTIPRELPNFKAYELVMMWAKEQFEEMRKIGLPPWLYMWGSTGRGKTRCGFLIAREFVREGALVEIWTGGDFKTEVVEHTRPRPGEPKIQSFIDFIEPLRDCDLLWFDECDKIRFSERVESEFFNLLEHRAGYELPTVFSCASNPEALTKELPTGVQILRRIVENSLEVNFDAETETETEIKSKD